MTKLLRYSSSSTRIALESTTQHKDDRRMGWSKSISLFCFGSLCQKIALQRSGEKGLDTTCMNFPRCTLKDWVRYCSTRDHGPCSFQPNFQWTVPVAKRYIPLSGRHACACFAHSQHGGNASLLCQEPESDRLWAHFLDLHLPCKCPSFSQQTCLWLATEDDFRCWLASARLSCQIRTLFITFSHHCTLWSPSRSCVPNTRKSCGRAAGVEK